jgi:hypothetical protein
MAVRGRPRLARPAVIYQIKLRLHPGPDDDLIAFLAAVPPRWRAAAVKQALRTGRAPIGEGGPADEEQMATALADLLL